MSERYWAVGHAIRTVGAHTGHVVRDVAYCNSADDAVRFAAAPELYEACEGIVAMCETLHPIKGEPDDFIYDELGSGLANAYFTARSALSKARGE